MIEHKLQNYIAEALQSLYQINVNSESVLLEQTKSDFEGDYTLVVFPYLKQSKKSPEQTAIEIGNHISTHTQTIQSVNVIKGFLNIVVSPNYWINFLSDNYATANYGFITQANPQHFLVEYSSPNTNKPLHLGHMRNIFLGHSISQIVQANGHKLNTCSLVNDRGIHICKSMLAWMQEGNGETPETTGLKGDHFVGKYYVLFDKKYKQEITQLEANGKTTEEAEKQAPSILAAQELLRKWEANDEETINIWRTMNGWVYSGFDASYKAMGITFDKYYYESQTYILGKEIVEEGLAKGVFFKKADGSVWIDLTADGLDQKLVLRADGTSVYITQDLGTADLKYADFNCNQSIYIVGNEQDYHFKVLKLILQKLGKTYADGVYHLSYGMVELPAGKMKSREGTVVDADVLMQEMIEQAEITTKALGKADNFASEELTSLYNMIGLGALKYFILKVDAKKKMLFNPAESIDFQGNTGPFIQYTHARIKSILRNAPSYIFNQSIQHGQITLSKVEQQVVILLHQYPTIIADAGKNLSPATICNYVYELAKSFNHFYHEHAILKEPNTNQQLFRLQLCMLTAEVIRSSFNLLGIQVPNRM